MARRVRRPRNARSRQLPWLAVVLLLAAPQRARATPASGPASAPSSRPATTGPAATRPAASSPAAAGEEIDDPLDPDAERWPTTAPGAAPRVADSPRRSDLAPRWSARAALRLAADLRHDSPRQGAAVLREDVVDVDFTASAWLQLRPWRWLRLRGGARVGLHLTARRPVDDEPFFIFNGDLHRSDFEVHPEDTFVEVSLRWLDLQAGMVTTVWGTNDLVNPNDVLSAKDLRFAALTEPESLRLPQLTVKAEAYLRGFTLSLVWLPVFAAHRVDLFGSDFALFGPGVPATLQSLGALADGVFDDTVEGMLQPGLLQTRAPRPVSDSSVALRVARSVGGWDLAFQYAFLHERLPVVRFQQRLGAALLPLLARPDPTLTDADLQRLAPMLLSGDGLPFESTYRRQHHVGFALSKAVWQLVLDLDVSYFSRQSEALAGGGFLGLPLVVDDDGWYSVAVDSQVLAYTVGARYARGERLLLKVEWWHELLLDQLVESADERPELLLGGPQRGGIAVLFRVFFQRIDLQLQLLTYADLINGSLVATPELAYRINDHLRLLGGVNLFVGHRGPGALYGQNDRAYIGVQGKL